MYRKLGGWTRAPAVSRASIRALSVVMSWGLALFCPGEKGVPLQECRSSNNVAPAGTGGGGTVVVVAREVWLSAETCPQVGWTVSQWQRMGVIGWEGVGQECGGNGCSRRR